MRQLARLWLPPGLRGRNRMWAISMRETSVLVQGITGREAKFWTKHMLQYGTRIVAGVTPGKGGEKVHGVPVYDTVRQAIENHVPEVSVLFVPAMAARDAVLEALDAGLKKIIVLTEHIPLHHTLSLIAAAEAKGAEILGPNTPGIVIPGEAFVGIMPAWLIDVFRPGAVGVISRSGSLGMEVCYQVLQAGFGQSAFVGIGGDQVVGTSFRDALEAFEHDDRTQAVMLVGEIGGNLEQAAASYIPKMSKPVIAFIAGRTAPPGRRMGHAGAIVQEGRGTALEKVTALQAGGGQVADTPADIARLLREISVPA